MGLFVRYSSSKVGSFHELEEQGKEPLLHLLELVLSLRRVRLLPLIRDAGDISSRRLLAVSPEHPRCYSLVEVRVTGAA